MRSSRMPSRCVDADPRARRATFCSRRRSMSALAMPAVPSRARRDSTAAVRSRAGRSGRRRRARPTSSSSRSISPIDAVRGENVMLRARHLRRHHADEVVGADRRGRAAPPSGSARGTSLPPARAACRGTARRRGRRAGPRAIAHLAHGVRLDPRRVRRRRRGPRTNSNDDTCCGALSSSTSKSSAVRSVTATPFSET